MPVAKMTRAQRSRVLEEWRSPFDDTPCQLRVEDDGRIEGYIDFDGEWRVFSFFEDDLVNFNSTIPF